MSTMTIAGALLLHILPKIIKNLNVAGHHIPRIIKAKEKWSIIHNCIHQFNGFQGKIKTRNSTHIPWFLPPNMGPSMGPIQGSGDPPVSAG